MSVFLTVILPNHGVIYVRKQTNKQIQRRTTSWLAREQQTLLRSLQASYNVKCRIHRRPHGSALYTVFKYGMEVVNYNHSWCIRDYYAQLDRCNVFYGIDDKRRYEYVFIKHKNGHQLHIGDGRVIRYQLAYVNSICHKEYILINRKGNPAKRNTIYIDIFLNVGIGDVTG